MSDKVQGLFNAKIRKVVLAYESGVNMKAIAQQVGVSAPTVAKWLTGEGYRRKGSGRIPLAMKSRGGDLQARGWGADAISKLLGLSVKNVDSLSGPHKNPVFGREKDPLKIKGQKKR